MSAIPTSIELHIHSVDGRVSRFVQNEPEAVGRLFDHIHPGHIFEQRQLVVASGHSLAIFPCAAVVRVDLVMEGFPDWEFHHGLSDVQEITEAEFRERYHPELHSREHPLPPGAPVVAYAEIELANAERLFSEVHTHVETRLPVEQSMFFQQILTGPSLYSRRRGGGAILVNPASIVRMTFYPGPLTMPANALPAEPAPA